MRNLLVGLALAAMLAAWSSPAADAPAHADTPAKFASVVERIHAEMAPGGRYEYLNEAGRAEVDRDFDEMMDLLRAAGSVDAMNDRDRVALFNRQEKINGILVRNSSDRLVCQSVETVGSHIPLTTCKTVRQLAQDSADLDRVMGQHQGLKFNDPGRIGGANWYLPGSVQRDGPAH